MSTVAEHYSNLLSHVYLWMVGGMDAALAQGAAEMAPFCEPASAGRTAVDLGAGFGTHAIPLARSGYVVTAVDTSPQLLSELCLHSTGLGIHAIEADLLNFQQYLTVPFDLAVCMGDTLTHLPEKEQVEQLFSEVARSLAPGGTFVLGFRDYTQTPSGHARFIPVRSDCDRILTCFLETLPTHMEVHDVLHERDGPNWRMQVSSYKKLRLSPDWVVDTLETRGFRVCRESAPRGMVRIVATTG